MSLNVSEKGGASRPLTPSGTHIARCFKLIDLGTQHDEYKGQPKILQKIRIYWELPNELAVFKEDKGEEPYSISSEYTASLGEKANLRHHLEGWRGRQFTEEELKGFDLKSIVGKPCMITVVHQKSKDGTRTYDKVTSVSALPKDPKTKKAIEVPPQVNASVIYDIEDGENQVFNELPEWIQKIIRESDEFKGPAPKTGDKGGQPELEEDSIPF